MEICARWTLFLLVAATGSLRGQGGGIVGPRPNVLHINAIRQDTAHHQAVVYNWQEPALIGGAILGGVGNLFGYGICVDGDGTTLKDRCALVGEMTFLSSATLGGGIAGLIGSTSHPSVARAGYERHGDRRRYGALMLAIPSLAVNVYGVRYECGRRGPYAFQRSDGCNMGNVLIAALSVALNGWIGARIGKGIPAYRKIE